MSPCCGKAEGRGRNAPADRAAVSIGESDYILYAIVTDDVQTVARDWHGGEVSEEILLEVERRLSFAWYEAIDACLSEILRAQSKEGEL